MKLIAVDDVTLWFLMAVGAVFAAAGLWLLLKPRPTEGSSKLELFGMKVETGSAGVLVVLIGAGFLLLPLIAPVRERDAGAIPLPTAAPATTTTEQRQDAGPRPALLLPAGPDAREQEPNDALRQSNQIAVGSIIRGFADTGDKDWFVVPVDAEGFGPFELKLNLASGSSAEMRAYDSREEPIEWTRTYGGASYLEIPAAGDRFYVSVEGYDATYELSATRKEN